MEGHLLFNKAVTKWKNPHPPQALRWARVYNRVLVSPVIGKDVFVK